MKSKLTILLILMSSVIFAQLGGGIIYGSNHSYMLSAPDGWVLDNKAGVPMGLHAVFYPNGESWQNAPIVMYTNFVTLSDNVTLDTFINDDIIEFKKKGDADAKFVKELVTDNKNVFKIYCFTYKTDSGISSEYVGFCRVETGIVNIICNTTKGEKLLKSTKPKYEQLVKSFMWMGSDVKIEK